MTDSGLERELKLVAADAGVLDAVIGSSLVRAALVDDKEADSAPIRFRGIYYDTEDGDLVRQRCSLRARQEGARMVAALKMAGEIRDGLSSRMEYETPISGFLTTARDLPEGAFRARVAEHISLDSHLCARVEVDMQRRIRNLVLLGDDGDLCLVELVADDAVIHGGGLRENRREVELELKSGSLAPLLSFGRQLQQLFDLHPSTRTKYAVGLHLSTRASAA